jgi:hypothetical protein
MVPIWRNGVKGNKIKTVSKSCVFVAQKVRLSYEKAN